MTVSLASIKIEGAMVSMMLNTAILLLLLPHSSAAVKRTDAVRVAPQLLLNEVKLLVHVTWLHESVALAPPLFNNHSCKASSGLPAEHDIDLSWALVSRVGAWL